MRLRYRSREFLMTPIPYNRTKVFISYSHKDAKYLQRLQTHFAHYERMGLVDVWDDTKLPPGTLWQEEIKHVIALTRVAILLVSADFLASQFIAENELPPLLAAAQTQGATIIPVILSACAFEASSLARFQAVNNPSKPISSMNWNEKEKIWATVARIVSNAMNAQQSVARTKNSVPPPLLEGNKEFEKETAYAQQLVLDKPRGWEYLLTAELLRSKMLPIKRKQLDIQNGSVYKRTTIMKGERFVNWAQAKCNDLASLVTLVTNILNKDIPASWGPPGVAGDPLAIKRAVEQLIYVCDEMLKREIEIRFVNVPKNLAKLKFTMEGWSTEFINQIDSIPDRLSAPFAQPNPTGTYEITLYFYPPASIKAFNDELRKLRFKMLFFGKKVLSS